MKEIGAIIILNYNNYFQTIEAINYAIEQEGNNSIIVVDNNSSDGSYEILTNENFNKDRVHVIKSDFNGGYSCGNNLGIKYIESLSIDIDYVCIMNPDVQFTKNDTIINLWRKMYKNHLSGITGLQITNDMLVFNNISWMLPRYKDLTLNNLGFLKKKISSIYYKELRVNTDHVALVDVMPGCFFMMNHSDFKKIGLFDENVFLYNEENILGYRAKNLNLRYGISLEDFYIHNHSDKLKELEELKERIRNKKISYKSQMYYAKNYLKIGCIKTIILKLTMIFNLMIEIPMKHLFKKNSKSEKIKYE